MNWKDMSLFYKAVFVLSALSLFALLVVVLCSFGGVLPGLYETPLFIALFGTACLGQAILNWKKQRVLAIFNLVTVLICFAAICCWLAF